MTKNRLYTIVLGYKGGTYVAQVPATSAAAALTKWLSNLKDADLSEWKITREELAKVLKSEKVVPLDNCMNVWCISGSVRAGLALINIVATDKSS
jgi:hypothetical protein